MTLRAMMVAVVLTAVVGAAASPACAQPDNKPFPVFYDNTGEFRRAMAQVRHVTPLSTRVSGITLPHHLLAMDLIARSMALLKNQHYERIILLSPDHFRRSATPFAVPARDFSTCFGPVTTDRQGTQTLLQIPQVSVSNLFSHEHGVQGLLPFLARYFPQVPVLPVALRISSTQKDWDALVTALRPLLTDTTLVMQSTDFSHYLTWEAAVAHDRETLRTLAQGRPELIAGLHQPRHLDSRAAQYIQLKLQGEVYGARPTVVANANSSQYLPEGDPALQETTSYMVHIYSPAGPDQPEKAALRPPETAVLRQVGAAATYYVAGDFFTGRYLRRHLENPQKRQRLVQKVREITGDAPLIVNLEGVLAEQCPPAHNPAQAEDGTPLPPPAWQLCMPQELTLSLLADMHVVAAGLANNHSRDYGQAAYAHTRQSLQEKGIVVLERDSVAVLKDFALAAFTDVDNSHPRKRHILQGNPLRGLPPASDGKPLFAFMHWGTEGQADPGQREQRLASQLHAGGVSLILGHHAHRAARLDASAHGAVAWSLGNFLFDQPSPQADGAVLELTFFPQGTFWARLIPVGNLYTFLIHGDAKGPGKSTVLPDPKNTH